MIKSLKQFFADLKATSKYLWYVVRFLIYCVFIYIAMQLMSIASTVGNTVGFLLMCSVAIIGVIRTFRLVKNFITKHFS
jgi:hypothetical protein